MKSSETHRGLHIYLVLGAGLLSISVSAILIRYASSAPGEVLAVWRTLFAALILAPFALFKAREEILSFTRKEYALILVSGIFLGLHFVMWISSLYYTSIASASVLVSLSPIFLAVIGFLILSEKPDRGEIMAIIVATAGTALLSYSDFGREITGSMSPLFGNSLALTAALAVSVYLLIGRIVRKSHSWLAYVAPLYAVTALTTFVVALARGIPLLGYDASVYGLCLVMAVVPQLMGHGALNYVIRYFPVATIGLATLFEPVGASFLAYLFFGEIPTFMGMLAIAIILLAVSVAIKGSYSNRFFGRSENRLRPRKK